jgi:chromodomain-helicase-DNA-binding protein 1
MILDLYDELLLICEQAVEEAEHQKKARAAAGEVLTPAQKSKAVLVIFRSVSNINAETVVSRCRDLKLLYSYLHPLDDPYTWRIPIENIRPTLNWSGRWGPVDDSMLLVGCYLYGFGNWERMAKDPKLGLDGKFFLEEGKKGEDSANKPIPNAIHLVRRGDFLLGLLREQQEKVRAYESSFRGKGYRITESPTPTPAPSLKRRAESDAVSSLADDSGPKRKKRRPTPTWTDTESEEWYAGNQRIKQFADRLILAPLWMRTS